MFQVRIISEFVNYSKIAPLPGGIRLSYGEILQAKDGGRAFCYLVQKDDQEFCIDADYASVVH